MASSVVESSNGDFVIEQRKVDKGRWIREGRKEKVRRKQKRGEKRNLRQNVEIYGVWSYKKKKKSKHADSHSTVKYY